MARRGWDWRGGAWLGTARRGKAGRTARGNPGCSFFAPGATRRAVRVCVTKLRLAAALLLLLAGCGPEWPDRFVLSPQDDAAAALLQSADERWELAGVDPDAITVAPGGLPVTWHSGDMTAPCKAPAGAPKGACACIVFDGAIPAAMVINTNCPSPDGLTHEVGHLLAQRTAASEAHIPDAECSVPRASRPVMCAAVGGAITELDLELACGAGACVGFNPEH